ncbi:MAG: hypothetical protein HRU15_18875 [Planctomycetes bacterium]|nr:hypothetical protein [Planctomycetota bacterium]
MNTKFWTENGAVIERHPLISYKAFLGSNKDIALLEQEGFDSNIFKTFSQDKTYNPNPYNLDLPKDLIALNKFVLESATWGPDILKIMSCLAARHQLSNNLKCSKALRTLRDKAYAFSESYLVNGNISVLDAQTVADECSSRYEKRHAASVWSGLGSSWMALMSLVSDYSLQSYDSGNLTASSSSWINRNSVWPYRSLEEVVAAKKNPLLIEDLKAQIITELNNSNNVKKS